MADITNLFKATVKAVKIREQVVAQLTDRTPSPIPKDDFGDTKLRDTSGAHVATPTLSGTIRHKSEFSIQANEIVSNISRLQEFLLKYRKDYINATGYLGDDKCPLTDAERDQIDSEAETCLKSSADAVQKLKLFANSHKVLREVKEHKDAVIDIIGKYLSAVCQFHSEQKAIRVKRVVDHKRIARLERDHSRTACVVNHLQQATPNKSVAQEESSSLIHQKQPSKISPSVLPVESKEFHDDDLLLSEEERLMLQMENEQVFHEMNGMVDEVRQIEGKLVEISRLQEIFANKILQQETDINKIADTVVGTTENIKDANEEIREAMKNNAGFRIWILFFLIVCSFSLLFLDWYND